MPKGQDLFLLLAQIFSLSADVPVSFDSLTARHDRQEKSDSKPRLERLEGMPPFYGTVSHLTLDSGARALDSSEGTA